MLNAALKVNINVIAFGILGSYIVPVGRIYELYIVKLLAGNLSVDIDSSVGEEASHLVLSCLEVEAVVTVVFNLEAVGYSLCSLVPCCLTYSVVTLFGRMVGAGHISCSVVCSI